MLSSLLKMYPAPKILLLGPTPKNSKSRVQDFTFYNTYPTGFDEGSTSHIWKYLQE